MVYFDLYNLMHHYSLYNKHSLSNFRQKAKDITKFALIVEMNKKFTLEKIR